MDRRGEVLYRRGFFNTVRINKRSISSDDVSGGSLALLFVVLAVIIVGLLLLLSAYSLAISEPMNDNNQRNPNITDIASNIRTNVGTKPETTVEVKKDATTEAKVEVVVDSASGNYYLPGCSQLGKVKQHNRRNYDEQQAISFGFKKHKSC